MSNSRIIFVITVQTTIGRPYQRFTYETKHSAQKKKKLHSLFLGRGGGG